MVFLQASPNQDFPQILLALKETVLHWLSIALTGVNWIGIIWAILVIGIIGYYKFKDGGGFKGAALLGFIFGAIKGFVVYGIKNNIIFCDEAMPLMWVLTFFSVGILLYLILIPRDRFLRNLNKLILSKFNIITIVLQWLLYLLFYFITYALYHKPYNSFPELSYYFSIDGWLARFLMSILPVCP